MITASHLSELFPRAPNDHLSAFSSQAPDLFAKFAISTSANSLEFFLAQVGHESGGLTIMEENLSYSAERLCLVWPSRFPDLGTAQSCSRNPQNLANTVYCGRMGNGPIDSGDGWRYRGRGYIQLTGREAYRSVGNIAGLDLEEAPELAIAPANALLIACSFWQWKKLNEICESGDFVKVTRRINGGTHGMADRNAWLDKVRRILADPPRIAAQPSAAEVITIQRALQSKGFREIGAADGIIGPRTSAAITRFRQANDLGPGLIDDELKISLGVVA